MKTTMKTIIIDGAMMPDRLAAHDYLAQRLNLPAYYGRNLDALHDCLTEIGAATLLVLYRGGELRSSLGDYAEALVETLRKAARENPKLSFAVDGEDDLNI